jgi:excinuclease ABC subunit B
MAPYGEFGNQSFRISFYDDEVESIHSIDPTTGQKLASLNSITLYPTNLFVTTQERINSALSEIYVDLGKQIAFFESEGRQQEAQRIMQRVEYDLEMIKELGYCSGIENYSRYFDGRAAGTRPFCLLDFFPQDFLTVIDESHVSIPQINGMFGGDRARKENLVEYGFRLPAAKDNRPLTFYEFESLAPQMIFVSATPADYEMKRVCGRNASGIVMVYDKPSFDVMRPTPYFDYRIEAEGSTMREYGFRCLYNK